MMLGFANGAVSKEVNQPIPDNWKEVTDWILAQSDQESVYTYWHDKTELRARKEAELQ
jgi:hypothetical protein